MWPRILWRPLLRGTVPTTWTLEDLYRGIARGWKALAIAIVVCLLAALAAFRVYPERYAAAAVHTVEPISVLSTGSSFATVNMDTEQIVATSTGVLQAAADALDDGTTVRQLMDATQTEVPRGSQVLRFIVTTSSPASSAAWANAIASAYGTQRADAARDVVQQTSEELQSTIDELRERLNASDEGSPEYAATELQLEALIAEQARLLSTPFYSGSLITPAVEPGGSERPSVLVFAAGGLFLGLLLGAFAALLWDGHLRRRKLESASPMTSADPAPRRHVRGAAARPAFRKVATIDSVERAPGRARTVPLGSPQHDSSEGDGDHSPRLENQASGDSRAGRGLPAHRRRQSRRR